eukprot:6812160-Ditylum_brightwellii.AAC.1
MMTFLKKYLSVEKLCDEPVIYELDEVGCCIGIPQWYNLHSPVGFTLPADMYAITVSTWVRSNELNGFTLPWKTYNSLDRCMVAMPMDLEVGPSLMDFFYTLAISISATRRNEYY